MKKLTLIFLGFIIGTATTFFVYTSLVVKEREENIKAFVDARECIDELNSEISRKDSIILSYGCN